MMGRRGLASSEEQPAIIAVIGGVIMDLVFQAERMPKLDESLDASSLVYKAGGKGSNTSVAIYRTQHTRPIEQRAHVASSEVRLNGVPAAGEGHSDEDGDFEALVYMNTAVGDDGFGRKLKKELQQNGINTSGVRQRSGELTGTCAVFVEEFTGESRDIGFPGAYTNWTPRSWTSIECLADGKTPDLVVTHLENKWETIEKVLNLAGDSGVDTLLNPSPVSYLLSEVYKNVTHLLVNEKEAAQLSPREEEELTTIEAWRDAARYFLDLGLKRCFLCDTDRGWPYSSCKGC